MSRYCIINGIYCEYANINGRCVNTACRNAGELLSSNRVEIPRVQYVETKLRAEWRFVFADFNDGAGLREYPYCTNCSKPVYPRDAGKYCTFCGAVMKNPLAE
jgi:hypothetical protein